MRIAALYDIHGNLPALEAVLKEVHQAAVDLIVVGGDVFPGPMSCETLALLRSLKQPVHYLRGNGEAAVLAERAGKQTPGIPEQARNAIRWGAEQLSPEEAQWIGTWPATLSYDVPGLGTVLFCHATPRSDTEIFTRLTAEERLLPIFETVPADVIVCGHTHMQFERCMGRMRIVNAGSIGMPFGAPGADWLLLGSDIQLRHTAYDLNAAALSCRGFCGHSDCLD
jgi:predicted phosphodiesterase